LFHDLNADRAPQLKPASGITMKILFGVMIVLASMALLRLLLRGRNNITPTSYVTSDRLPAIVGKLQSTGSDGSFVVFMFSIEGSQDEILPNLQYSIEGEALGLDWVLSAPGNVRDESAIADFMKGLGYSVSKREMNDVRYLRVEGSGLADLGIKIFRDFYHLDPQAKLELITEGFDWRP
jgi:hypothetical protein